MRSIKFRGVHPSVGAVMDVCVIDWMHDEVYFEQGSDVSYSIEDCKLMQFTGLTDQNGVEIYEGDIVQMYYQPMHEFGHKKRTTTKFKITGHNEYTADGEMLDIRSIRWIGGALMLHCDNGATGHIKSFNNLANPGESFEIIGNIHQNPELLES